MVALELLEAVQELLVLEMDHMRHLCHHYLYLLGIALLILSKEEISKIQSILRYEAATSISGRNGSSTQHQNIRTLYVRVAAFIDTETKNLDDNVVFYDLCNSDWEVIKITGTVGILSNIMKKIFCLNGFPL